MKSAAIVVLVVVLAVALFFRPSRFALPDYGTIYTQSDTRTNWTRELLKSYPFIVASVPVAQWDATDSLFAEKVLLNREIQSSISSNSPIDYHFSI